jgi:hypothetical protein
VSLIPSKGFFAALRMTRMEKASYHRLVPKLHLGTQLRAKLSFADPWKGLRMSRGCLVRTDFGPTQPPSFHPHRLVPKLYLGTQLRAKLSFADPWKELRMSRGCLVRTDFGPTNRTHSMIRPLWII